MVIHPLIRPAPMFVSCLEKPKATPTITWISLVGVFYGLYNAVVITIFHHHLGEYFLIFFRAP